MILGQGIDIVQISRMAAGLERFGEPFAKRLLSASEWPEYQLAPRPEAFLAKRFAAKEAFAKALGTGFREGLSFRQISVVHDDLGAPKFKLTGQAQTRMQQHPGARLHLTLSDEREYAVAMVTLEATDL